MDKSALRRGARTGIQSFIGTILALLATGQFTRTEGNAIVPDLSSWDTLLFAAGLAAFIAILSFVQNWLEDTSGSDGFLVKKG